MIITINSCIFTFNYFIETPNEEEVVTYEIKQLTISPENTLFHYIHLEAGEGIFLAPLTLPSPETHPLHTELVHNFRAACQIIHNTFQVVGKSIMD